MRISKIFSEIDELLSEASWRLTTGKDARGRELTATALERFQLMTADDPERGEICEFFANILQRLGDFELCEQMLKEAFACDTRDLSANHRGTREMFYAKFLRDRDRLEEAEHHVLAAIAAPYAEIGFAHDLLKEIRALRASAAATEQGRGGEE